MRFAQSLRSATRATFGAVLFAGFAAFGVAPALAQDGMKSVSSPHDVATTMDRLEAVLAEKGMTVFARIDHAAGADSVGIEMPGTQVLVFGNPKVGSPLMLCAPSVAIDLPQKMLAWEDATGATRLGWNDPTWLRSRHDIEGCDEVIGTVSGALDAFAAAATAAE